MTLCSSLNTAIDCQNCGGPTKCVKITIEAAAFQADGLRATEHYACTYCNVGQDRITYNQKIELVGDFS